MTINATVADLKLKDLDHLIASARKVIVTLDEVNETHFGGVDERLSQRAHGVRDGLKALIELRDSGNLDFDAAHNPLISLTAQSTGGYREGLDLLLEYMNMYATF